MFAIVKWTLILYLILKTANLLLRRGGYGRVDPSLLDCLRSGEPMLIIVAFAISASTISYSRWWVHRWATRDYQHATDCLARLQAGTRLPHFHATFRKAAVGDSSIGYYDTALAQGARLGIGADAVRKALDQQTRAIAARYSVIAAATDRTDLDEQLGVIDRCLKNEWAPHGEILNP